MKEDAEEFLRLIKVTEAVITVLHILMTSQRQANKECWKIAGFDVKRIVNEPTQQL
jgi:molecular chaperone DnaK